MKKTLSILLLLVAFRCDAGLEYYHRAVTNADWVWNNFSVLDKKWNSISYSNIVPTNAVLISAHVYAQVNPPTGWANVSIGGKSNDFTRIQHIQIWARGGGQQGVFENTGLLWYQFSDDSGGWFTCQRATLTILGWWTNSVDFVCTNTASGTNGVIDMGEHTYITNALGYVEYGNLIDAVNASMNVQRDIRVVSLWIIGGLIACVVLYFLPVRRSLSS